MSLGMIAVLALIVWAVFVICRKDNRHADFDQFATRSESPAAGAEQILAERFARGEIDADQYHGHAADLHQEHPAATRS